ncbi:MAG: hypothetical protein HY704_00470 [Gemmatimonadetes bacterium]|nr:hypothetical protein [Gemmatimonadota bacterium]
MTNRARLTGIRLIATPSDAAPPFAVDAVVLEEDTYLVLTAERDILEEPEEGLGRLLERAAEWEPEEPGSVIVRTGSPLRLLAVVHDLDLDPTWREEWIARALGQVLREVERLRVTSMALPVLGSVHGTFAATRFAQLLQDEIQRAAPRSLRALWITLPPGAGPDAVAALRELGAEIRD